MKSCRQDKQVCSETEIWYVAICESQAEPLAAQGLHARGFHCYLPSYPKRISGNYNKRRIVYRPLLPGYIFAAFDPADDRWKAITRINGIRRIILINEKPVPVPDAALHFIKEREWQLYSNFGTRKRVPMPCKIGDWVQVTEHFSFTGLFGRVVQLLDNKERIILHLDVFGRQTPCEMSVNQVRVV